MLSLCYSGAVPGLGSGMAQKASLCPRTLTSKCYETQAEKEKGLGENLFLVAVAAHELIK